MARLTATFIGRPIHPGPALAQRPVEHVVRERFDQACLLDKGDELVRRDKASLRVLPADQGFDGHDAARREGQLWLVVEDELLAFQGAHAAPR